MIGKLQFYAPAGIEFRPEHLLRIQGYRDMSQVRADVKDVAEAMVERAMALLAPEVYYRQATMTHGADGSVNLGEGSRFQSQELTSVTSDCHGCIVFVLTLGPQLDDESQRLLMNMDVVEALFLESAGWVAIEQATRDFAQHLASSLSESGQRLTRRLGPGYADWPLEQQAVLFDLLKDAPLKVQLLESYAMLPKQSRSGLYGVRPEKTQTQDINNRQVEV